MTADARNFSQRPHHTPQTPITMRHGPGTTGAQPVDNHIHAPPYGQHRHTPRWCEDGANTSIALSTTLPGGLLNTADSSASTARYSGTRREVRLPQTSDTVALHGSDPPRETSVPRCGGTHSRRFDIRDLCPSHAHVPHGSDNLSQGPSGINASLLEPPDGHKHFIPPDHTDPGQEINTSAPYQVQTGVCPQSQPTVTQQSFVLCKAVPRLLLQRSFRTIFWTQKMTFLREKKTSPTHHGQAAQRPQHECITQMHLRI